MIPNQIASFNFGLGETADMIRETARNFSRAPEPEVFALPGNHDWYDSLVSFTRLFCSQRWFQGWRTRQRRSYFALKLPGRWWLVATDFQLGSDIDALQELGSQGLVMFVQNVLIFVGTLVVITLMSWQLTLCTIVVVPPVLLASRWFRRRSNRAYLEVRDRISTNLSTLQEGLEGVRVVQAYGREGGFIDRFEETNEAQYEANIETVRIATRYFPVVEFTGVFGIAVVVGAGAVLVDRGTLLVGTVLAFVLYLSNLFEPIQQLSQLYNTLQSAAAALHKLFGILDTVPDAMILIDGRGIMRFFSSAAVMWEL